MCARGKWRMLKPKGGQRSRVEGAGSVVGGKGEWWRQVVDAVAEWWAAEANVGGGWRHVVDAAEANATWRGQVVGDGCEWWVPEVNGRQR